MRNKGTDKRGSRRQSRIIAVAATAITLVILLGAFGWTYYGFPALVPVGGTSFNRGENGLWLRYLWYKGDPTYWSRLEKMLADLRAGQIRQAYFHVRELKQDGRLALRDEASGTRVVGVIHDRAPGVKAIAWVSLGDAYPAYGTDLANPTVRARAVSEAVWLTERCGFDGVQWDYEPCKSGDRYFLSLLQETRTALAKGKIVSVSAPMCSVAGTAETWYSWDQRYFGEVAALVDEVVVMCYDVVRVFPWQYVEAVEAQVPAVSNAVGSKNPHCRVKFGVPTYDRDFLHDRCETLRLALKGIREGFNSDIRFPETLSGIAIFADYTTDSAEWKLFRQLWLGEAENASRAHRQREDLSPAL